MGTALALPFNLLDQRHSHFASRGTASHCLPRGQPRLTVEPLGMFMQGQVCTARAKGNGHWESFSCPCILS